MGLIVSDKGGSTFEPVEPGVHQAICYGVIDIGTQHNQKFNQYQRKMILLFELPLLRIQFENEGEEVDKPKVISRIFTASLNPKSHLRPFLESWRGKPFSPQELLGFDMQNLLGVNCQLNIIHKEVGEKTYANITAAMPLGKDMVKLFNENDKLYYSIEDHQLKYPESTPEWIVKKIKESVEYNQMGGDDYLPEPPHDEPPMSSYEDDIPF